MRFPSHPPTLVNAAIGRDTEKAGAQLRAFSAGESGHALYGPYAWVTHGVFQVDFEVALGTDKTIRNDPVCVVLDVVADEGQTLIAERRLRASDLGQGLRTFSLLFVMRRMTRIEHRVAVTGAAAVLVGCRPVLPRIAGVLDEAPEGCGFSPAEMTALAERTRTLLRPLAPWRLTDHAMVRMGGTGDGGYVCVDDLEGVDTAFSFGISGDIDWDVEAAARGLTVYQFDHTVSDPAPEDPRMVFEAKRIGPTSGPDSESLSALIGRHDKGRAQPNLILKMDIEGDEWDVIDAATEEELGRLAWITCELHRFQEMVDSGFCDLMSRCLAKLSKRFAVVHLHSNVCGGLSKRR